MEQQLDFEDAIVDGQRVWTSAHPDGTNRKEYEAEYKLTGAYRRVFMGSPSKQDQEMVLADMLAFSGFSRASDENVTNNLLLMREGRRQLYARLFSFLNMGTEAIQALELAARMESIAYGY